MAVLGSGGQLRLKREAPEPTVLRPGDLHLASRSIYMRNPAFWSGDEVTLSSANGLPLDTGTNGPDCPDGHGTYAGSDWFLGSNRSHLVDDTSLFYKATNTSPFYLRESDTDLTTTATYYIYRDQLDRLSFYTNRADSLRGDPSKRVELYRVDFRSLIVSATGTAEYESAIAICSADIGDYNFSDAQDEVTLASICDFAPDYLDPPAWITEYDNADLTPRYYINGANWMIQAYLSEWTLNLSAPEVDTTAVGERFGESVKSVVTGGGTMDFLIERTETGDFEQDSTAMLNMLLMTEKGCKADAQFWMIQNREERCINLPGSLYYETQILITSIAINTRATDIIAGSLNFVTVGEIALRMGLN